MVPLPAFLPLCNRQYVVGERYRLSEAEDRSHASHAHYFACINEVWKNLPDHLAVLHPDAEHLRKWALCRTEYHIDRKVACSSEQEARRIAAFLRPTDYREYVEISVSGNMVIERKPKSQSMKAMGKIAFQDSKDAVLNVLSELIGISLDDLSRNAGRAA